jgi:FtsH-binding integral membrane protein
MLASGFAYCMFLSLTSSRAYSYITLLARVYAILSAQLLVTAASVGIFARYPHLAIAMISSRPGNNIGVTAIPMLSLAVSTVCWITICMSPSARRSSPMKWQLLSLFTLGEAIAVGFISSFYMPSSVLSAVLATATTVASISLYTARNRDSKHDLSTWGASLSSAGLLFCVYGLLTLFQTIGWLPQGFLPYHETAYSFLGATLFSGYLAYHTRLIVSGKHTKYQMNEKDYVFGAMSLYNDIISMFIYILRMVGEDRDGVSTRRRRD